jgi:hypothetical protein
VHNTTIVFTPTRAIITPPPPMTSGVYDPYTIFLTLSKFEHSATDSKVESESLSGKQKSVLYFSTESYACETAIKSVLKNPLTPDDTSTAEMEMFARSVMNKEIFAMTNLDSGEEMWVQCMGRPRKSRNSNIDINEYTWSFTVREVVA